MFSINIHGLNLLRIKQDETVFNAFLEMVKGYNLKPNTIWVDQVIELYNKRMQESLQNNVLYT